MPKLVRQKWWPENPYEHTAPIIVLEKVDLFNQGCMAMVNQLRKMAEEQLVHPDDEALNMEPEAPETTSVTGKVVFIPDDKE